MGEEIGIEEGGEFGVGVDGGFGGEGLLGRRKYDVCLRIGGHSVSFTLLGGFGSRGGSHCGACVSIGSCKRKIEV